MTRGRRISSPLRRIMAEGTRISSLKIISCASFVFPRAVRGQKNGWKTFAAGKTRMGKRRKSFQSSGLIRSCIP